MPDSHAQSDQAPVWDLSHGFGWNGWNDPKLQDAISDFEHQSKKFNNQYKGQLKTKLESSVKEFEQLKTITSMISYFLTLSFNVDCDNNALIKARTVAEAKLSKTDADYLTFYALEIANLSDEEIDAQMTPGLAFYNGFLHSQRKMRPHLLSQEVERALTIRTPWISSTPICQDYEKRMSNAKFQYQGETFSLDMLLSKMSSSDANTRREALKCVNEGLESNGLNQIASISLNCVTGSWWIESQERHYKTVRSRRNLDNDLPDEVVNSLLASVRGEGVELARRFYLLKKGILQKTQGLEEFTWADRNAPLALKTGDKVYTWEQAVEIVSAGYNRFSPTLGKLFHKQIDEKRIHALAKPGKKGGAECEGIAPSVGPYQFLSFNGTPLSVQTLAHESGHGCHFILSYVQGILQFHPAMSIAEVASIFGEMIVWRDLLEKTETDEERLGALLDKVGGVVNSVVRQCSFDRFEELVHEARGNGIISDEDFDKYWMQATVEYYGKEGDVFDKYENLSHLWSYVPHFHEYPFYVYSYAFADLVVGALYSVYMKKPDGFEERLLQLLSTGSTKTFVECLEPFGLHPDKPEFWTESLQIYIEPLLHEAEEISEKLYGKFGDKQDK